MKICLINPPLITRRRLYYMPLGLAYIAAVLRAQGYDVSVADSQFQSKECILQSARNADVVGITCMSYNSPGAFGLAHEIKKSNPTTTIVMGGPHVTFTDVEVLQQNPHIDIIVRHEGESTMKELVHALQTNSLSHVKGITYRENDKIKRTPKRSFIKDLDSLPFPARDLFKAEQYYREGSLVRITSGRGCPYRCIFCSASSMWGHSVRLRSPKNVADEIEQVLETYRINRFSFVNDTFTIFTEHTVGICEELLKRGLHIKWGCNARVDTLNEDLVQIMKKAGCTSFFMGIESGNQKTLDLMNKKVTTSQIRKAVQLAKTYSIEVTLSCILGFPNETYSDVQKTIDFMISLEGDRYLFNFLMIYPGTEIERRQKELNIKPIADDTWGRVAKTPFEIPTVETENLSVKDLSRLYIEARLKLEGLVESREVESSPI